MKFDYEEEENKKSVKALIDGDGDLWIETMGGMVCFLKVGGVDTFSFEEYNNFEDVKKEHGLTRYIYPEEEILLTM